jgi:hypothetical protein
MVTYLAFDSRSIKALLGPENSEYFDSKFPLFYKNAQGNSSVDVALGNNQIRSVSLMIEYIVQNQNSYFYSHLFEKNLVDLLQKGVQLTNLFNSKIFYHDFDFDDREWPATNSNTDKMLQPYNESMFDLRFQYKKIFREIYLVDHKKDEKKLSGKQTEDEKVYKIKYQLNILPSVSEQQG